MDKRHRDLVEQGEKLFADRQDLASLCQEVSLHFYPEMAEFTGERNVGRDFAGDLTTSYPLIARRTLGDALSALLRPVTLDTTSPGVWFGMRANNQEREDDEAKAWMERGNTIMRRAMYDRPANFVRATKEGDHSFATFGQCIIEVGLNLNRDGLLYRSHHLKDVVWTENGEGKINMVQRMWNPTASMMVHTFGNKAHEKVKTMLHDRPHARVKARHIVIDRNTYEQLAGKTFKTPWISLWIDIENDHLIQEIGSYSKVYVIPRWMTIPGSQYASSPAVMVALPDARLIQAMAMTILEAGEKFADPPIMAKREAIRSDLQLYKGGITWVDAEYDERLEDVMRPLYQPTGGQGVSIAMQMSAQVAEGVAKAFFLDSLSLPPMTVKEMTRFEVEQRVSEWIRRAVPIFEPMEFEYNGALCEETFEILLRNGAFGPLQEIPRSLSGAQIQFKFESPLHESVERRKGQKFLEAKEALIQAAELDPSTTHILNATETLRDIYDAIGVPRRWIRSQDEVNKMEQARQEEQQAQQMMMQIEQGAGAVKDIGAAVKSMTPEQPKPAAAPKKKPA